MRHQFYKQEPHALNACGLCPILVTRVKSLTPAPGSANTKSAAVMAPPSKFSTTRFFRLTAFRLLFFDLLFCESSIGYSWRLRLLQNLDGQNWLTMDMSQVSDPTRSEFPEKECPFCTAVATCYTATSYEYRKTSKRPGNQWAASKNPNIPKRAAL